MGRSPYTDTWLAVMEPLKELFRNSRINLQHGFRNSCLTFCGGYRCRVSAPTTGRATMPGQTGGIAWPWNGPQNR